MNIKNITNINLRKLKKYPAKAMFLIVPIAVLIIITVITSSQIGNIRSAAEVSIFDTMEEQATLLSVKKEISMDSRDIRSFMQQDSSEFTETDLDVILGIENVQSAEINSPAPITNISTTDLFEDITVNIGQLTGLSENISALFTSEEFSYTEGESIPIILNANTFIEEYEDWGGETEIIMEMRGMGQPGTHSETREDDPRATMPQKQRAISYEKNDLIGKEFTLNIGGFDELSTTETKRTDEGMVIRKLAEEEIQENEDARRESISPYWDYDKLASAQSYTFKVVGVIESETDRSTYVPAEFISEMMTSYISNQLDARNDTEISVDDLNSVYAGLTYDGLELKSSTFGLFSGGGMGPGMGLGMGMKISRPEESSNNETTGDSYTVPGLVVELSDDGEDEVLGIYDDPNVYDDAVKSGDTITIKTESVFGRAQVINDLNELGYAYQDVSNLDVIENLESTLNKVSTWLTIVFIGLTIAVIILTMSKFVSESRRDIGIFRAIGMTKTNILTMFISQAVLYTGVGYLIGSTLGVLLNMILSVVVNSWFVNFVGNTIQETYNVVNQVDPSIFRGIDWSSLGAYSIVLLVITLLIAFIPAQQASSISPVEAIRGE